MGETASRSGSPQKAENLGILGPSRQQEVLGQDGVTPIPLNEHVTMWTFGDSILGTWKEGQTGVTVADTFDDAVSIDVMIANSVAFTATPNKENVPDLHFEYYKENGKVAQFVKNSAEEDPSLWRLWTTGGIRVGRHVYVYYMIITTKKDPGNALPFYLKGMGLARWEVPSNWQVGDPVDFVRLGTIFGEGKPTYGDSVIEKDGFLYLIGHGSEEGGAKTPAQIARVRSEDIEDEQAYEFLRENGSWTRRYEESGRFLGDVMGECSLTYNSCLKKFVIIYCQAGSQNICRIVFEDFGHLAGAEKEIVYIPPKLKKIEREIPVRYYSAKEIFYDRERIYAIYIHPVIYQPILLGIDYP